MAGSATCAQCGDALPPRTLGGLCPRCIAQAVSAADPSDTSEARATSEEALDASTTPHPTGDAALQIEGEITRGGMGVIYRACDAAIGRSVVVKFLNEQREGDPAAAERFLFEGRITGQLEHPGIVPVYHLGTTAEGRPYYAMRHIEGESLGAVLDRLRGQDAAAVAQYPLTVLLGVFQKICDAVAYAHSRGVIHRDLKPDNVMIGPFGEVLVTDWGLAKNLREPADETAPAEMMPETETAKSTSFDSTARAGRTLDNTVLGTPGFMAPEQAHGQSSQADERTDVYALGALLYAILTLRPPIRGRDVDLMLSRTRSGDIRPPTDYNPGGPKEVAAMPLPHCPNRRIPGALSAVAMKALATLREDRYQNVPELQRDIAAYQGGFATSVEDAGVVRQLWLFCHRHRTLAASSVLVLLLLGAVVAQTLGSNQRMRATLAQLRATAPAFFEKARTLVDDGNLEEALGRVDYALTLVPTNATYHELRGNILQARLRFKDARDAYARALRYAPGLASAITNRALCEKLIAARVGEGEWPTAALLELQMAMQEQGRAAEALALAPLLKEEQQKIFEFWTARLEAAGISARHFSITPSGLEIHFHPDEHVKDSDLAVFRGMPLVGLNIDQGTNITSLAPLKGMPLLWLEVALTRVQDLTPLQGMNSLRHLGIGFAPVSDLRPLKGLRLTGLIANNTRVRDLTPLQGMPLVELVVSSTRVEDLSPLRGMSLQQLDLLGTRVTNITPLAGMPLRRLRLQELNISDLTPLKGMPLTFLSLFNTKVSDLSPLAGMPLETLELDGKRITNIGVLHGMPLKELYLKGTAVKDFTPLRGMLLKYLTVEFTTFSDLRVLEGMPLETLSLRAARVTDLTPIQTLPNLAQLELSESPVVDLTPLKNARLTRLSLYKTRVADISALAGQPLRQLTLHDCPYLRDVSPLASCRELERLTLPTAATNVHLLRTLPALRSIAFQLASDGSWPDNAAAFWRAYDARRPAGK